VRLPAPFAWRGEHVAVDLPGGHALFTTRRGGASQGPFATLNLGLTVPGADGRPQPGDDPAAVAANRRALAGEVGVRPHRVAHGRQVHGTIVHRAAAAPPIAWGDARLGAPDADGQATALGDLATVVLTADCLPVALVADGAVAMVHAGWRGLAGGVIEAGVEAVRELGGHGPIAAAIGPGAGGCCYEVDEDVHGAFAAYGPDVRDGRRLDLPRVAADALRRAGVNEVHDVALCTMCAEPGLFFSHRRDGGVTGRQAGLAWRS
jgi:YfiH family protein